MCALSLTPDVGISYVFGPFRFSPGQRLLTRDNVPVRIGGKAFNLLHLLLVNAGEKVSKQTLIQTVWPDTHVDEASLKVHISSLRRALGDNLRAPEYVATIAGYGYQFVERVLLDRSEPLRPEWTEDAEGPCFTLPAPNPLIGRESDAERITLALDQQSMVTLVGAGGVGKTSLAIFVAHRLCERFSDGAHFVDLSTASISSLVPQVIARSLGLRGDPPDLVALLSRFLSNKRVLLILDNCEHVRSYAADLSATLVAKGIGGALLATSREPLGNRNEQVVRIEPLVSPRERSCVQTVRAALTYPALELFLVRARESLGCTPSDTDVPEIVKLCQLLDGLPLAIELVAARLDRFSPGELHDSMKKHLPLAAGGARDRHPRQRTLRATLDWSFDLLATTEVSLLCALSTFAGAFGPTDVNAMGQLRGLDPHETIRALGSLVSKSLIVADVDEDQPSYRFLTTTRTYALARLERESFADDAHRHHAKVVLGSLERAEAEWGWTDHGVWRARHAGRVADIRKALDWCFSGRGDIALGVSLVAASIRTWNEQSLISDQRFQVKRALLRSTAAHDMPLQTAALAVAQAWSLTLAGHFDLETVESWQTALRFAEKSGSIQQRLSALFGQAVFLVYAGRPAEVLPAMSSAREIAEQQDAAAIFDVDRLEALARLHLGHLTETHTVLQRLSVEVIAKTQSRAVRYHLQRYVGVQTTLALSSWLIGDQNDALDIAEQVVATTGAQSQLMGQAHTLSLAGLPLSLLSGRYQTFERYAALLQDALSQEVLAHWVPLNRFFGAFARSPQVREETLLEAQESLSQLLSEGFLLRLPMYLSFVIEGWLSVERPENVEALLQQARKVLKQTKEAWYEPELLRISARHAGLLGNQGLRERLLLAARSEARQAGSLSFELKATNDLASGLLAEGKHKVCIPLLSDVMARLGQRASQGIDYQRALLLLSAAQGEEASLYLLLPCHFNRRG